jgi:hypothetical protein
MAIGAAPVATRDCSEATGTDCRTPIFTPLFPNPGTLRGRRGFFQSELCSLFESGGMLQFGHMLVTEARSGQALCGTCPHHLTAEIMQMIMSGPGCGSRRKLSSIYPARCDPHNDGDHGGGEFFASQANRILRAIRSRLRLPI